MVSPRTPEELERIRALLEAKPLHVVQLQALHANQQRYWETEMPSALQVGDDCTFQDGPTLQITGPANLWSTAR